MKPMYYYLSVLISVILFSLFLPGLAISQDRDGNISWAGAWPFGTSEAVAVDTIRSYGYLSSGGAVLIMDISSPGNPVLIDSSIRTTGQVLDIHVDYGNNNLLLACDESGMEIWDVDDVQDPGRLSNLEIFYGGVETPVRHIELYDDFAVTENRWGYVHTINISDPSDPFQVAFNGVMGNPAHDISVSSDGYIHATGQQYVVLLEINPDGSLNLVANYYYYSAGSIFGTEEASFFQHGGNLNIINYTGGSGASVPAEFHDIVVRNNMAYMIGSNAFMIFDVTDLSAPFMVSTTAVSGPLAQVDIMGDHAFIACGYEGMRVLDISDPSNPTEISHYDGTGVTWATQRMGNYSYLSNSSSGVSIVDISDPMGSGPEKVAGIPTDGETRDLAIEDEVLYFADWTGGLRIYDVQDPLDPNPLGSIQNINAWRVDCDEQELYVVDANPNNPDTLLIYDVTDPANPVMLSNMLLPDLIYKMLSYEDHLYFAAYVDGLVIVDVSDPVNPAQVATVDLPDVSDIDIEDDTAFVASTDWDGGLVTIDVSDPTDPQLLNIYNPSGWYHPFHVAVEGDYAYTGENFGDLKMFDVSDPLNPQEIDDYVTSGSIVQMEAVGNFLYVADGPDGMQIMHNEIGGVTAGFFADNQFTCEGDTVHFTDQSTGGVTTWSWTFEGGDPGSSTQQNPTVAYNSTGDFDVELIVSDGFDSDTLYEEDYIIASATPAQAGTPAGPQETCQDGTYGYTIDAVPGATTYEWMVDPSDAGTISGNYITGTFEADSQWSGSYEIMARASNNCGDGPWSPGLSAILNVSPEIFTLNGGGSYCEGTGGLELILDGSETGVDYELFLDSVSSGMVLSGTGEPLSFGFHTEEGEYYVVGSNLSCSREMAGVNYIYMLSIPGQAAKPEGDQMACNDQVTTYTSAGATDADTYTWMLSPDQAGTLVADSLTAEVTWSQQFTGTAMLSLYGSNECGDGPFSDDLIISVSVAPTPEVNGPDTACAGATETYMTDNNPGSIYLWIVYGGDVVEGDSTYQVTVIWNEAGEGNLVVTEETGEGCIAASEEYEVDVLECTQIDEISSGQIEIYPNPAGDRLYVKLDAMQTADLRLSIHDITGIKLSESIIATGPHAVVKEFDISYLTKGTYIIKVFDHEKVISISKFIKR